MSDLISRQDAINVFGRLSQGEYYTSLINAIPSAEPERKWVPCSERLPEKSDRYLVTQTDWEEFIVDWDIWYNDEHPSWLYRKCVIAWMPLPEPWKGGKDD